MVKFERFIDKHVGNIIIFFLSIFKKFGKKQKPAQVKNVLIVKFWAIGDSVVCLPLIRAIKEKYPNSKISVLTRKRVLPIFSSYNKIDYVINLDDLKQTFQFLKNIRKYDLVFDTEPYMNLSAIFGFFVGKYCIGFSNQYRSKLYDTSVEFKKTQHMVQNYLDMFRSLGFNYNTKKLEKLTPDKKFQKKVSAFLKKNKILKKNYVIGVTPGAAESARSRMWFEERFAKLCDLLINDYNLKIIFIDGPSNIDVVNKICSLMKNKSINAVGKFNIEETLFLIQRCDMYISNDTGPMHMAAAQRVKTIGLFGPNTPVLWAPYGKNNISIIKTTLKPSINNDKGVFPNINREGYMGPIEVSDVYNAVKKLKTK